VARGGGEFAPIEELNVDDLVLACDEDGRVTSLRRVTRRWVHEDQSTVRLHLDDGEILRTTLAHRFFAEGKGFVCLGELAAGDRVRTLGGGSVAIARIEAERDRATVYNLSVDGSPTYFVGRAGLWVHNVKTEGGDWENAARALAAAASALQTASQAVKMAQRRGGPAPAAPTGRARAAGNVPEGTNAQGSVARAAPPARAATAPTTSAKSPRDRPVIGPKPPTRK